MSKRDLLGAALIGFIVIAIAAAIFTIILRIDADAQRNDRLQQQCIARGGNWDYGCDMRGKS